MDQFLGERVGEETTTTPCATTGAVRGAVRVNEWAASV